MRTAARRDGPERSIIAAAEALGAVVLQVSGVGLPDTLVLHEGRTYLVEVKQPGKSLTHAQSLTFARITKTGVPVYVLERPGDIGSLLLSGGGIVPWKPGARAVDGQKKRKHRPGHSRAERVEDLCAAECCPRSRLPGLKTCAKCAESTKEERR